MRLFNTLTSSGAGKDRSLPKSIRRSSQLEDHAFRDRRQIHQQSIVLVTGRLQTRALVHTGLVMMLPPGYEAQVRPRSGLALRHGVTVLNSPGTIDADYRGEVCVILVNLSDEPFLIADGERIAQLVIARHEQAEWEPVEVLPETKRGSGGFGHSGTK